MDKMNNKRGTLTEEFKAFQKKLLRCYDCNFSNVKPNPIVWGETDAKTVQISQAPSLGTHKCGRPFSKNLTEPNASGKKLIEWYDISEEAFYNPHLFYITGIARCYPGKKHGGDADPPVVCAEKWLEKELSYLNPKLYLVTGKHSAKFLFPNKEFTKLVFDDLKMKGKPCFVLPHPSPANRNWFKTHPEFETKRLRDIQRAVHQALS